MALLENCAELGTCNTVTNATCPSGPNANLNPVGMSVGDYLCACQEERPVRSYESPNRKWKHAFLRKLFFGTMKADNELFGEKTAFFTLKDVQGLPSKSVRSITGKEIEFLYYKGNDFFTNVTTGSTGTTLTVKDSSIFSPCMSIEIVTQSPTDDCCYETFIRKVISVPSATTVEVDTAVTVSDDARVIVRFNEALKCSEFCPFDKERKADKFKTYYQTIGHKLCFDVDDLNACNFTDFNETITNAIYGMKLKNKYELKSIEMMDLVEHEILMAINTGRNTLGTTTVPGETLGIETAMAYAKNVLGVENDYKLKAMSPRAIFQALIDLVIDKQRNMSGSSGDYLVGVTAKLYSWIRNNQEYLRPSGETCCTSSDGVYRVGNVSIDTGYGKLEFVIDPYIEMKYREKMIARFLPNETTKFYTQMYNNIDINGNTVSVPGGMKVQDVSFLNAGKVDCEICHVYSYKFAFIPSGALSGEAFKLEIVQG